MKLEKTILQSVVEVCNRIRILFLQKGDGRHYAQKIRRRGEYKRNL